MIEHWKEERKEKKFSIPHIKEEILSIQSRMRKIEEKLFFVSKEGLIQKLEEEWSALEVLQKDLEYRLTHHNEDENNIESTLLQAERMFTEPSKTRKENNYEIRQLLLMVWFGGILFYKKNE